MNVYAINSKGEIKNKIENVSCFYPLSQYIIMAENEKYYFANKKGNPVDNNSYYKISVPHLQIPQLLILLVFFNSTSLLV